MTFIVTTDFDLNKIAAPNLPLATQNYSPAYQDQLNNVLRLYFNRLDSLVGQLTASDVATTLDLPNGAFHQNGVTTLTGAMTNVSTTPIQVVSTAEFPAAGNLIIGSELVAYTGKTSTTFTGITRGVYGSTNVAHAIGVDVSDAIGVSSSSSVRIIPFTSTDYSNGVALNAVDATHIDFSVGARYNLQFSAQFFNVDSSEDIVTMWLRLDNVDVPQSAGRCAIAKKTGAGPGLLIVGWNQILDINAGSYIELCYSSITGNSVVASFPAQTSPVTPVSPAVIFTATFVSKLP